jgi:phage shock protein PspC (stress-responsive transcriptional regulator)
MESMRSAQRLRRSSTQRVAAGLCGGLGRYLGLDPTVLRLLFVVLTVFSSGFGLLLYAGGWLVIPRDDQPLSIAQRRLQPVRAGRGKGRFIASVVGLAILLGLAVAAANEIGPGLLVAAAVVAAVLLGRHRSKPRRRRTPSPPPALGRYDAAQAAWQSRLDRAREEAARPAGGYTLSEAVRQAADLTPPAQGFLAAPNPLDLADARPMAAAPPTGPAPASGTAPASPNTPPAGPPATGPSLGHAATPGTGPSLSYGATPASGPAFSYGAAAGPATSLPFSVGPLGPPAGRLAAAQPIPLTAFLAHPAPAPEAAAPGMAVAVRRKRPVAVGWVTLLALAAAVGGLGLRFGSGYLANPAALGGTVAGVFGSALVLSPWTGRPRWLAPVTGLLLAGSVAALFILTLFIR